MDRFIAAVGVWVMSMRHPVSYAGYPQLIPAPQAAFSLVVEPVLQAYAPDLVIVAAGFDAADGDPVGDCSVSGAMAGRGMSGCEWGNGGSWDVRMYSWRAVGIQGRGQGQGAHCDRRLRFMTAVAAASLGAVLNSAHASVPVHSPPSSARPAHT